MESMYSSEITKTNILQRSVFVSLVAVMVFNFTGLKPVYAATESRFLLPDSFSNLAKQVGPAVVNIRTEKVVKGGGRVFRHFFLNPGRKNDPFREFFGNRGGQPDTFRQQSLGSGFIIDLEGHIVTNNHVVENADSIKVRLKNEKEYNATVVGRDPHTDLALIKIESGIDLTPVKLGDSDKLEVGNWVMAIGSPFGLEQTVTTGIVSAKGRVIGAGSFDDFIQTDASINPGNSGGPLLNLKGEVIGINTAIINGGQGIGFAIPVTLAKQVINQLKNEGTVSRGWLGVEIHDLEASVAEYYGIKEDKGVLITRVFEDSPAEKAEIKADDIILEVNGQKTRSTREIIKIISAINPGKIANIRIMRDREIINVSVKVSRRKGALLATKEETINKFGIKVSALTPSRMRQFGLRNKNGVIIAEVEAGSQAYKAGLHPGDIIKEINHKRLKTIDDYQSVITELKKGETADIVVFRMNRGLKMFSLKA